MVYQRHREPQVGSGVISDLPTRRRLRESQKRLSEGPSILLHSLYQYRRRTPDKIGSPLIHRRDVLRTGAQFRGRIARRAAGQSPRSELCAAIHESHLARWGSRR